MTRGVLAELINWTWVRENFANTPPGTPSIVSATIQHIELALIAVVVGTAISLPLGIWAYRRHAVYVPVTVVSGLLYTVPSLALFVLLIPITGLSVWTVEIGLVSYTLLILIRNVVAGLASVPADVKDAARGMGMTKRQLLWRVELPLALPVIVAGVRVATVSSIALVTVGAVIGFGGLGYFILDGLNRYFFKTEILVGIVLSVILALLADAIVVWTQRLLMPWSRRDRRKQQAARIPDVARETV